MAARSLAVFVALSACVMPAAGSELELGAARIVASGQDRVAIVDVANATGVTRALVGVRFAEGDGVLEIREATGWETVPSLRIPGHAELRMDAERGPRVRLPPGAPDLIDSFLVGFDDGSLMTVRVVP